MPFGAKYKVDGIGRALAGVAFLGAVACGGPMPTVNLKAAAVLPQVAPSKLAEVKQTPLAVAAASFAASQYQEAEARYRSLLASPANTERAANAGQANLGLARVLLVTGRYAEAAHVAEAASEHADLAAEASVVEAEALRRQGQFTAAQGALERASSQTPDYRLSLALAEILQEEGNRYDAKQILMSIIDAHNQGTLDTTDARTMGFVGRAAELLRSPRDANDAYNDAEQASTAPSDELLLWRGGMFLDKHDPGHAEEIFREILAHAPNQPEALVGFAQVKLAQTMDFEAAETLARRALAVNPRHAGALFVLAGVALRDLELDQAEALIKQGLEVNPRALDLLSLQATVRFLADDTSGFRQLESTVLSYNRQYSRFYDIVGEYADWEHRYDAIVEMMREATRIDDGDVEALAGLGTNLIRIGDDDGGVAALKRAFAKDPFNVRVFNTLNLYDQIIPSEYESEAQGLFRFRYGKSERPVLQRYVPALVEEAWRDMVQYYGFTPKAPIGVELYADRKHFAVRTSGLPNIGIQGVCFGKTLAVVTPKEEPINLGMTLWHELSHVFHIQLSKSHVPRWFTEGLAEYETSVRRPEWHRERGADLFRALRDRSLPPIEQMNRAFSHAESMDDLATAYAASTQIVTMLAEHYGRPKLRRMLVLWGEGKTTSSVMKLALGASPEQIDAEFRDYLLAKLARYTTEFVPLARGGDPDRLRQQLEKSSNDLVLKLRLALALLEANQPKAARPVVEAVLRQESSNPDARFLLARLSLLDQDNRAAEKLLIGLTVDGHDGYAVESALAEIYSASHRASELEAALLAAYRADPTETDPLYGLWHLAQEKKDTLAELDWLRKLARLEPHSREIYGRLLQLLIERQAFDEAIDVGQSALYADLEGTHTHLVLAEALAAKGDVARADFEFESATLCPEEPKVVASATVSYAKFLFAHGKRDKAKKELEHALEIDPENSEATRLGL